MTQTLITVLEAVVGFTIGYAIAKIANRKRDRHIHKWGRWETPFEVLEIDHDYGNDNKTTAARQSRRCEVCGVYEQRRVGIFDQAWDNDEPENDPPTKVEPISDKPA